MKVRVKDEAHPLCSRCRHGSIRKSKHVPDSLLYCDDIGKFIRTEITECSQFSRRGSMTFQEMKAAAWIIEIEKQDKIGFVRPGDKRHREILTDLPYSHPFDDD